MPLLTYWTREKTVRNMDNRDWFHLNQGSPLLRVDFVVPGGDFGLGGGRLSAGW